MRASKPVLVATATLATAVLAYFGTGLTPFWPLLWFAPVPVLVIATGLRTFHAFLAAFLAWLLGELNQWTYFTQVLAIPLPVVAFFLLIPATLFALGVLFTRSFLLRQSPILGALALPTYWVTWEYLSAMTSPHGTFGNLGYSQMSCLALIQVASITGIWALSFTVFLFAATVAALVSGAGRASRRRILVFGVGACLCTVFIFGEWRLVATPAGKSATVTLLAKDVPMSTYLGPEEQALELLAEYANELSRVTPPGTEVVVLPEKIARINEKSLAQIDALFAAAGRATRAAINLGIVRQTADGSYNSSRYYGRDGKVVANYDKHHLLPGVEPEKPGRHRVALDQSAGRWGLQICKDMDFPQLSREYAGDGINLLLVPAWDFQLDRWLHARMAVLRAVENGFALARSARNGLLTLADSRGRIVAEKPTLPDQFVALTGRVAVHTEKTFYSRSGDWFARLCVASFILLLGYRLLLAKRERVEMLRC